LENKRADAYSRIADAQATQSKAALLKAQKEADLLDIQIKAIKEFGTKTIDTTMGKGLSLYNVAAMQALGIPVKGLSGQKYHTSMVNASGEVKHIIEDNGEVKAVSEPELQGYKKFPATEVRYTPFEKAAERAKGKESFKVTTSEWVADQAEELGGENPAYRSLLYSKKPADKQKVKALLHNKIITSLGSKYSEGKVGFLADQEGYKAGYYHELDGEFTYIRGPI